jgi:hypothetical protein
LLRRDAHNFSDNNHRVMFAANPGGTLSSYIGAGRPALEYLLAYVRNLPGQARGDTLTGRSAIWRVVPQGVG